jgi:hypothetical protein
MSTELLLSHIYEAKLPGRLQKIRTVRPIHIAGRNGFSETNETIFSPEQMS